MANEYMFVAFPTNGNNDPFVGAIITAENKDEALDFFNAILEMGYKGHNMRIRSTKLDLIPKFTAADFVVSKTN